MPALAPRSVAAFLAAIALALLLPGAALARTWPLPAPEAPAMPVRAGQEIVTRIPALPAGVREFELVLVPEVGPAVAVTAEHEVGEREVRWRMPHLPGTRARLVLRTGDEHSEYASAPSAPFTCLAGEASVSSAATPRFDASDWLGDGARPLASLAANGEGEYADAGLLARSAEEPDDGDAAVAPAGESAPRLTSGALHSEPTVPLTFDRQPRFTPLRN